MTIIFIKKSVINALHLILICQKISDLICLNKKEELKSGRQTSLQMEINYSWTKHSLYRPHRNF